MPTTKKGREKPYLNLNSYTYKLEKNIREPPDCTGNEPTPDIPLQGSGQDIKKKKWQIHAIWENMLIMKHVSHLSKDREGKNP